ncbi:hypothetical protein COU36_04440 [Candidatus Micrarchaeota archaeon CG10_big_fil_rev_8_21_14_0_10_59_7]|nr:MAG: hypothetical protein COU36_04440 [Candidatus Micrarchaeota archaeon CG10_big_fil_rev_8_21_14_0_10_59_7]
MSVKNARFYAVAGFVFLAVCFLGFVFFQSLGREAQLRASLESESLTASLRASLEAAAWNGGSFYGSMSGFDRNTVAFVKYPDASYCDSLGFHPAKDCWEIYPAWYNKTTRDFFPSEAGRSVVLVSSIEVDASCGADKICIAGIGGCNATYVPISVRRTPGFRLYEYDLSAGDGLRISGDGGGNVVLCRVTIR